ncbi:MAG: PIG-L family deacetylase [Acetobacteraceae bacterium]|nr:PIG-L family deacetylase [Acetobacteraceae bacterium]
MRALPVASYDTITGGGPVLVVAPHPDDESLGCGGLIARGCCLGRDLAVAVVTDGTGSHPRSRAYPAPRLRALRENEARAAVAALGLRADRLQFLGIRDTVSPHPDAEPDRFASAAERIAALARAIGAGAILAPWQHDPHGDHVSAHLLAAAAAKQTGARHLSYPVWGWTLPPGHELPDAPLAGYRLDIRAELPRKRAAIAAHASQTTRLIADDPEGFVMPPAFRALFDAAHEVFLHA